MGAGRILPLLPLLPVLMVKPSSGFLLSNGYMVCSRSSASSGSVHGSGDACMLPVLSCCRQGDSQNDPVQRTYYRRRAHRPATHHAPARSTLLAMLEPQCGNAEQVKGAVLRRLLLQTPPPRPRSRSMEKQLQRCQTKQQRGRRPDDLLLTDSKIQSVKSRSFLLKAHRIRDPAHALPSYDRRRTLSLGAAALCGTLAASNAPEYAVASVPAPPLMSQLDQRSWQPLSIYAEASRTSNPIYPESFIMYLARILVVFDPMIRGWYMAQEATAPRTWPAHRLLEARLERLGCLGSSLVYGLAPFAAQGCAGSVTLWEELLRSVRIDTSAAGRLDSLCVYNFLAATGETVTTTQASATFEQQLAVLFRRPHITLLVPTSTVLSCALHDFSEPCLQHPSSIEADARPFTFVVPSFSHCSLWRC